MKSINSLAKVSSCDNCGRETPRRDLVRFQNEWLCGTCLNADAEPPRITVMMSNMAAWDNEEGCGSLDC